jgi:hypothetical protein
MKNSSSGGFRNLTSLHQDATFLLRRSVGFARSRQRTIDGQQSRAAKAPAATAFDCARSGRWRAKQDKRNTYFSIRFSLS